MDTKEMVEFDLIDMGAVTVEARGSNPAQNLDNDGQGFNPGELTLED